MKIKGATHLSDLLQGKATEKWAAYLSACAERDLAPVSQSEVVAALPRIFAYSEFVATLCLRHPDLLDDLVSSGDLFAPYDETGYELRIASGLEEVSDFNALSRQLRQHRKREMLRIAIRDLAGWADLVQTIGELSRFADACIEQSLNKVYAWMVRDFGVPLGAESGKPQTLVVLGMGKLGAYELNFSSDIDLIFAYPEQGQTNGPAAMSNEEFFTRLGRQLSRSLDEVTAYGQVFRVDMRLRPFGEAGALALGFDAMEEYYQVHGRDWERYALIKARPVAGDREAGKMLMEKLRPFVYRRYLDFGAFEAIREMKAMIMQQVRRKGMEENVKLGAGGIREVEFIGQVFQLIRGGRERELQVRPILQVLELLAQKDYLPAYVAQALREAYVFLRHAENRIQAYQDKQVHALPHDAQAQAALAAAMGFVDWTAFRTQLDKHMKTVHAHFEQVFSAPQVEASACDAQTGLHALWGGLWPEQQAVDYLSAMGFSDGAEVYRLLTQMRQGSTYRAMSSQGRERMDVLMPMMLGAAVTTPNPMATVVRLLRVVESIGRRSAYFALLTEHPMGLSQLARLCHASPWLADFIAKHPLVMDELLDPRALYAPLSKAGLTKELAAQFAHVDAQDLEQQMEILRHFKQSNVLKVAAADVAKTIPLMVVSDYLTEIAEVVLQRVLMEAWANLAIKHGAPQATASESNPTPGFAIVAYGKLGGIELGYGSDLDLVFIYDGAFDGGVTQGARPIENEVFFTRLGQRIIHMLATRTPGGVLYEVDMRLRPSGASGLLVTSLAAFSDYQQQSAWTWEHQALVRARFVAGDQTLGEGFNAVRAQVLAKARDPQTVQHEVREMRERMRGELGSKTKEGFDLKQDTGGIADIEFLVQYCVLRWAHEQAALTRWTDNIRILETLGNLGILLSSEASVLADAYRAYRAEVHRLTLQDRPARVDEQAFADFRAQVVQIWQKVMLTSESSKL